MTLALDHDTSSLERTDDEVLVRKSCSVAHLTDAIDDAPGLLGLAS